MANFKTVKIDPVTRVEGHGKVTININQAGDVEEAFLTVAEFRGFEKFCEGRMLWEMPTITSRICGFCPVSHHLASVKAAEALLGVQPPPTAAKLRELMHMGQMIHSHALHFFFCALPDFVSGETTMVASRSVFGLFQTNRNIAQNAVKLRKAGQEIIDAVGGGRLHPVTCIPGGMTQPLANITRVELLKGILSAVKIAQYGMKMIKDIYTRNMETFNTFATFPSYYMSLTKDGKLELYDGTIRMIDQDGNKVCEFEPSQYLDFIQENVDARSWTKSPYYLPKGLADGFYRVSPLARLNIAEAISTPLANAELMEFKALTGGKPNHGSLFFHYARMIELLYAVERAKELLTDPEILSSEVRIPVKRVEGVGVGVVEAPRGTLFHHYEANSDGKIVKANLIVSTAHNHEAINRSITAVAKTIVRGGEIPEKSLNKVEMAVRCYDPCLSCSSHAYGKMPLEIELRGHDGSVLNTYKYGDIQE